MRPARRTEKYPYILPKAAFSLFAFLLSMVAASTLNADMAKPPWPKLSGRVVYVTNDEGIMLIRPKENPEAKFVRAKLVGVDVPSFMVEVVSLNRDVECNILYETTDFLGVDCSIDYWGFDVEDIPDVGRPRIRVLDNMGGIFVRAGITKYECQKVDKEHFQFDPKDIFQRLYWLTELCFGSQKD